MFICNGYYVFYGITHDPSQILAYKTRVAYGEIGHGKLLAIVFNADHYGISIFVVFDFYRRQFVNIGFDNGR